MKNAQPEVIDSVNSLTEERFQLEVQRETLVQDFKVDEATRKSELASRLAPVEARIAEVDAELLESIKSHRTSLIAKGKQSFVTLVGKFQFKKPSATDKVKDGDGVMAVARKLGIVRQIATPVRAYKLDRRKFGAWLQKNPEYREMFDEYLEAPSGESLTVTPNSTYTVVHDSKRVSPPSISIKDRQEVD